MTTSDPERAVIEAAKAKLIADLDRVLDLQEEQFLNLEPNPIATDITLIDGDYEARKQAMINNANDKALARLEEIDRWVSERADRWPQSMPTVQYIEFMSTVTEDELNAYCTWLDSKLEILKDK